ncbi:hypothetical protein T4D_3395 [Trichinella pseudospiralis]|uniref:Uncharacterized protein n=1 Tax=Trichinella pseudospiralis TaxID=6337 RepID=A0A0V1F5V3_TRIPS|nr:hypothetical protein T4D_3395 [Trichinella pseudospiralis]
MVKTNHRNLPSCLHTRRLSKYKEDGNEKRDLWPEDTHKCKELIMKTPKCIFKVDHVVTAFLNLSLNEEICMEMLTSFVALPLRNSIYGLKQVSPAWYRMLDDAVRSFRLNKLKNEPCIYLLLEKQTFLCHWCICGRPAHTSKQ